MEEERRREDEEAQQPGRREQVERQRAAVERELEEEGPKPNLSEEILSIGGAAPTGATKATEDEPPDDKGPLVAPSEGLPGDPEPEGG